MRWLYFDRLFYLFYQGPWGMKTKGWFGGDVWLSKVSDKVNEIGHNKARPSLHVSEKQDQDQIDRTASKQKFSFKSYNGQRKWASEDALLIYGNDFCYSEESNQ